jgi:DNA-binding response OmpR family regulator
MQGGRCRILVIEDDRETADQIVEFLAANGYEVDLAVDGDEGLSRARSADYAVMTIDRMLPGIDGIAVIRRLREEGLVTPALIVSALGEIDDRLRGLRAGGDDYLVKPVAFAELLARVEALARCSDRIVKEVVLRVGDLELPRPHYRVLRCEDVQPEPIPSVCGFLLVQSGRAGNEARRLTSHWRSQEPQRWWQWVNIPSILPCLFGSSCGSSNFMTNLATSQVRHKSRSGGRAVATKIFCAKCFINAAHVLGALADPLVKPRE